MNITVIGPGRWGSFLAWYLAGGGHRVTLYGRPESAALQALRETRRNEMLALPAAVTLTSALPKALENEVVVVSVPSQGLRALMQELARAGAREKLFVLCMKGLEKGSGKRLTQVLAETLPACCRAAIWVGPGHPQDFLKGVPNCMVIDAARAEDKQMLIEAFSGELIRFYYGEDLIGNEIGAAAKNVVGIAAGMLDGFGLSSLKGALMSRGTREVARLIRAVGGSELSAYGLAHLGDYEATLFSPHSHNRAFGEAFAKGESYTKLAEGYHTVPAMLVLARQKCVELPICRALYAILYENTPPKAALERLFNRDLKYEFY